MSELALKLIAEAKRTNAKTLDLGMCGLVEIPEELFDLEDLEELYLCNSYWNYKTKSWKKSTNSKFYNSFSKIPNQIEKLTNLKILYLNGSGRQVQENIEISSIEPLKNLINLEILELGLNKINETNSLKNLTNLKVLNLRVNDNLDLNGLKNLTQLNSLFLGLNKYVKNLEVIKNLTQLKSLSIPEINISKIDFIKNLTLLQSLDLSRNKEIKDYEVLKNLKQLQSLDVSQSNFSNIEVIRNLTQLQSLDLSSNNPIENFKALKNLTQLKSLYLKSNSISNIEVLENLIQLKSLDLNNNNISNIEVLKNLTQLKSLNLNKNNISNIEVLKNLTQLKSLNLNNNNISNIKVLKNLTQLKSLNLSSNKISNIEALKNLKQLESFSFHNNKKTINFEALKNLTQLKSLILSSNNISNIEVLKNLTQLKSLNLNNNNISNIEVLKNLTQLKSLNLDFNKISNIESLLPFIKKGIQVENENQFEIGTNILNITKNPITTPPIEIIKEGNQAILKYFDSIKSEGVDYLFEAKMLIVGEGGAGKTSLRYKLQDRKKPLPEEEETTKGIDIDKMVFKTKEGNDFTINLWDFGGQAIYHATHQFFLTKRSLYVLVDDTRLSDKNKTDAIFQNWLQRVELFGGNSPLLIVQNEKGGRSKDIDFSSMRGQYAFIKEKYATDLKTCKGLDEVEAGIKHFIQQLPHIGEPLPKNWVKVREELITLSKSTAYISFDKYLDICINDFEIKDKDTAKTLSQYLHDLGSFLHFKDDPLLKNKVILQNEWATDAVYNVLDDETVKANKGEFTKAEACRIWSDETYTDMHDELLAIMQKFELSYKLDNKKDTYLIPQLLPTSTPDNYEWDKSNNLQLRYKYEFMPKGLLSRFIVRTHRYISNLDLAWQNGVQLEKNGAVAEVREIFGQKEIAIRVKGTNQRELMIIISEEIDKLNDSFEGLKVEKKIPCNCETCAGLENPHFYNYENVSNRIKNSKTTIECQKEPYIAVSVYDLITDIFGDFPMASAHGDEEENRRFFEKQSFKNEIHIHTEIKAPQQKSEIPESKPIIQELEKPIHKQWWFGRIIGGLLGGAFVAIGVMRWLEFSYIDSFLACSMGLTALLLFFGNPKRRFFRAASAALAAALSTVLLNLAGKMEYKNKNLKLNLELLSDYSWAIALVLIGLACYLFYLDFQKDKEKPE